MSRKIGVFLIEDYMKNSKFDFHLLIYTNLVLISFWKRMLRSIIFEGTTETLECETVRILQTAM